LRIAPPRAVALELQVGAGFRHYLATSPAILRHPDIHDAKIGSLQTLLPHLPPLIEQPAFGQLQIANELRKRGLTVSCRVLNEVPRDFGCTSWASRAGAPRGVRQLCSCRNPGAYLKLDSNSASSRLLRFSLKAPPIGGPSPDLGKASAPLRHQPERQIQLSVPHHDESDVARATSCGQVDQTYRVQNHPASGLAHPRLGRRTSHSNERRPSVCSGGSHVRVDAAQGGHQDSGGINVKRFR
jgi:hypothetical protein